MVRASSNHSATAMPGPVNGRVWTTRGNQGWVYTNIITTRDAGISALDFYASRYRHSSRNLWAQRFDEGQIHLDNVVVGAATELVAGTRLIYRRPAWQEPAAPRDCDLLYDDGDVLAVAKPIGLQVLPAALFLQNTLLDVVRERFAGQPAPAHRLGRGTSGIVLFARGFAARRGLSEAFRDGRMHKIYRALATGTDLPARFEIDQRIGKLDYPGLGYVYAAVDGGKASRSLVQVVEVRAQVNQTLVEVEIPTGRPHQIRIHLAAAGYPLVGDPLYVIGGRVRSDNSNRPPRPGDLGYHLHAMRVAFDHPLTGEAVRIDNVPPAMLCTRSV